MNDDTIYNRLHEIIGNVDGNLSILEDEIDIDLQMEYFEYSKNFTLNRTEDEIIRDKESIFKNSLSLEDKKQRFVELASTKYVEAYRTIERYLLNPETNFLKKWATLAFQESRMLLESTFLDENKIFISTGLGGKEGKLRYFIVLLTYNLYNFTELQKKIVHNEFEYLLKRSGSELESIEFADYFASMLCVIPLNVSIKNHIQEIIGTCNQFGNFLCDDYVITNVKKLSFPEIEDFLQEHVL